MDGPLQYCTKRNFWQFSATARLKIIPIKKITPLPSHLGHVDFSCPTTYFYDESNNNLYEIDLDNI